MGKTYRVSLFGKKGCDKCKILKGRLESLLVKDEWSDFDSVYNDIETEDGLVSFVHTECLNPQRIPSFVVEKENAETGAWEPLLNPDALASTARMRPWRYIGVETDYSEAGRGVITPKMVTDALARAKEL